MTLWNSTVDPGADPVSEYSAGFKGGQGARAPHHVHVFSLMYDKYVALSHFIREENLFVDAFKLSVVQTAVLHLYIITYGDETTITLIVFLKVGQVSESSECKAKPRRTH